MRAMMLTAAAAALTLAGCTMDNMGGTSTTATSGTSAAVTPGVAVVTPGSTTTVTTPVVVAPMADAGAMAPLPMLGSWTCESVGFTITPGTYRTAGGASTRIDSVERISADDYRLVLSDAKKIRLSNIVDGKLTWRHENAEGGEKTMTCTKKL